MNLFSYKFLPMFGTDLCIYCLSIPTIGNKLGSLINIVAMYDGPCTEISKG